MSDSMTQVIKTLKALEKNSKVRNLDTLETIQYIQTYHPVFKKHVKQLQLVGKEPLRSKNRLRLKQAGYSVEETVLYFNKGKIELTTLLRCDSTAVY